MADTKDDCESAEPVDVPSTSANRRQFSLKTILLMTAAIASWAGYFSARTTRLHQEADLQSLKQLARELDIADPQQYAAAQKLPTYVDQNIWRVYLPEGNQYDLHIALEGIPETVFPKDPPRDNSVGQVELSPGQHDIEIQVDRNDKGAKILVFVDDQAVINLRRDKNWIQSGVSHTRSVIMPMQQTTDRTLVLHQRTFQPAPATENGTMLWITKNDK